jgi:hypothetical protein
MQITDRSLGLGPKVHRVQPCGASQIDLIFVKANEEGRIGVDHRPFSARMPSAKLTLGSAFGETRSASRSMSAIVLRGRLPALVTVKAGDPLSVTAKVWPGLSDLTKPGEWKNSRAVSVFMRQT